MDTRPIQFGIALVVLAATGMGGIGGIGPAGLDSSRSSMTAARDIPHEAGLFLHSRNSFEWLVVRCSEDSDDLIDRYQPSVWTVSGLLGWTVSYPASRDVVSAGEIMRRQLSDPLLCASRGPPIIV